MSTEIIKETKKRNYSVTRFWGGKEKGVMYQITQRYSKPHPNHDWGSRYYGYVQLSEEDLELILKRIKERKREYRME